MKEFQCSKPEDFVDLGSLYEAGLKSEFWKDFSKKLIKMRENLTEELIAGGDAKDAEKRAMIFAIRQILELPHKYIETGKQMEKALKNSMEQKLKQTKA